MPEEIVAAPAAQPTPSPAPVTPASAAETAPAEDTSTLLGQDGTEKQEGKEVVKEGEQKEVKEAGTVPEKYEYKVPEGMKLDENMVKQFDPIFKELKLPQESVDKLVAAYAPQVHNMVKAQEEAAINSFKSTVNEWKEQTMKALGPEAEKEMAHAAKFINKFSQDAKATRAILNDTGLGNHPLIVQLLVNAGKKLAQDHLTEANKSSVGVDTAEEKANRMYPTMDK